MPYTQQRALPRFPATAVGLGGVSVSIAGGVLTISFGGPSISQYLRALSAVVPNARATMDAAISADPDNPQRVIFERSPFVPPGGAFEMLAATTLGLPIPTLAIIQANALLQIA